MRGPANATSMTAPRIVAAALLLAGCGGAGIYGHSPQYRPLGSERDIVAGAREYDPVGLARRPDDWRRGNVVLFGVVDRRAVGPGGQALLRLAARSLEPRNVCERSADDDSCRVTVSDQDFGVLWALVALRADDDIGPLAVGQRSLVRVVGGIAQDVSPVDGAPVVHAIWYRHWPAGQYTTRRAARMRSP